MLYTQNFVLDKEHIYQYGSMILVNVHLLVNLFILILTIKV